MKTSYIWRLLFLLSYFLSIAHVIDLSPAQMKDWYSEAEIACLSDENLLQNNTIVHGCSGKALFDDCVIYNRTGYWKGPLKYVDKSKNIVISVWKKLLERNVTLLFPGDSVTKSRTHFMARDVIRSHPSIKWSYENFNTYEDGRPYLMDSLTQIVENGTPIPYTVIRRTHMTMNERMAGQGLHHQTSLAVDQINYIDRSNLLILPTLGAWFNNREVYEEQLRTELDYFATLVNRTDVVNRVLWLAAWPQHFNSSEGNGYFSLGAISKYTCVPHPMQHQDLHSLDWRNLLLQKVITPYLSSKIQLFHDDLHVMNEMWDMHSKPFEPDHDCTHWCYHPMFMLPLWHRIGQMLDDFPLKH